VPDPVVFDIAVADGAWRLSRDQDPVRAYGHADLAVHEAVRLAQALVHTGQPAEVRLHSANGAVIQVDLDEPRRVATPGDDEASAIVPDRGPSA
jgi:hypothetical protein